MSYNYSHPIIYQFFEMRYAPVYALILLGVAFLAFLLSRSNRGLFKVLLAMGIGPLAFSFLRTVFFGIYHDNLLWPNFWEELTELMYVSGVGFILWLFRRGLFQIHDKPSSVLSGDNI